MIKLSDFQKLNIQSSEWPENPASIGWGDWWCDEHDLIEKTKFIDKILSRIQYVEGLAPVQIFINLGNRNSALGLYDNIVFYNSKKEYICTLYIQHPYYYKIYNCSFLIQKDFEVKYGTNSVKDLIQYFNEKIPTLNQNIAFIKNDFNGHSYTYEFKDKLQQKVIVVLSMNFCNPNDKYDNMYRWVQQGYIKEPLYSFWGVNVYVEGKEKTYGDYNPTLKQGKINFNFILEATEVNKVLLLNKIYDLSQTIKEEK